MNLKELQLKQEAEFQELVNYLNADYGVDEYKVFIKNVRQEAYSTGAKEERERIKSWAKKYIERDKIKYGTDKYGIVLNDLLNYLSTPQK